MSSEPTADAAPWPGAACPLPQTTGDVVTLAHGGGGILSRELVENVFLPAFADPTLARLEDAGVVAAAGLIAGARLALTTDCHVVQPLVFPGGSIGELAVHGTVNDLAMVGAVPRWLTAGFILEEGLEIALLRSLVERMAAAAREAGVALVAGDTKVVERGRGDGLMITTTGVGVVPPGVALGAGRVRPGDAVLVSGTLGDHGMAIMSQRDGLGFESAIRSDTAPLHRLVAALLAACPDLRMLRDPTRGGVAAALNEIATAARVGIEIDETTIPVAPAVAAACEILGFDPLQVANEGKLVAIVSEAAAAAALAALRSAPEGRQAVRLGRVTGDHPGVVAVRTPLGGSRIVPPPLGEQLPRIC